MKKEKEVEHLVILTAGLLASGHFTVENEDDECSCLKTIDNGKDWKEVWATRRYERLAVLAAREILHEIQRGVEKDDENGAFAIGLKKKP